MPAGSKKQKTKRQKGRRRHTGLFLFACFFLIFSLTAGTLLLIFYSKYGKQILSYKDKADMIMRTASREDFRRAQTSILYANDGRVLRTLRSGKEVFYIPFEEIPESVITAMIVTEDRKFYQHSGVDYIANLRAAYSLVKHKGTIYQGASTITQQLARNIYLTNEQTYERKLTEIFLAMELEKRYSKKEIMEFYLNNIYFANGYYGIQAAAHGYFNKGVAELSLSEQMFLCAIPNNPRDYDPYRNFQAALNRRISLMEQMMQDGKLSEEEFLAAKQEPVELCSDEPLHYDYAESYAMFCTVRTLMEMDGFSFRYQFDTDADKDEYLKYYEESYAYWQKQLYVGGYRVYTSLDMEKQELLLSCVQNQLSSFEEKTEDGVYTLQGAATCIDNETGCVVAIVGGREEAEQGYSLNRAFQSFRQPGSSIKPLIVYTPWLMKGLFPDTILVDEKFAGGPRNANGVYSGQITLRRAVEVSKNTVAWKLFTELTPEVGLSYITNQNFRNIVPSDYVPAASLGGLTYGVCTLEMAGGYCTLANDGLFRNPTCIVKITTDDGRTLLSDNRTTYRIYDTNAARMMTNILQGVMTNGTGTKLRLNSSVCAGKTGTTNDIKDGWFVGYTPYFTTAVWVGYDYPKELSSLAGNTYPGYIWKSFMDQIHEGLPERDFTLYEDNRPVRIPDDSELAPEDPYEPDDEPEPFGDNDEPEKKEENTDKTSAEGTDHNGNEDTQIDSENKENPPSDPPATGFQEYDDDWWREHQGNPDLYDDFYD